MLEGLGASAEASAVYEALIAAADPDIAELSERTGLPEDTVRSAAQQLTYLGLVSRVKLGGESLRPADPELALIALLRRREAEVARHRQDLAAARAAAATVTAAYSAASSGNHMASRMTDSPHESVLLGRQLIRAASHCLAALPDPDTILDLARSPTRCSPGGSLAVLCADSARSNARAESALRSLAQYGGQVRTAPVVPVRLVIGDQATALVWPGHSELTRPAVLVRDVALITALTCVFTAHWDMGRPLEQPLTSDPGTGLPQADHALLRLLAAGHTYEAAAHRLGISPRTISRRMNRITDELGAASAFQAGAHAARRGWI